MEKGHIEVSPVIDLGAISVETKGTGTPNDDTAGIGRKHGITNE